MVGLGCAGRGIIYLCRRGRIFRAVLTFPASAMTWDQHWLKLKCLVNIARQSQYQANAEVCNEYKIIFSFI